MEELEFVAWPKIPRFNNNLMVTITEKIDGTNACIVIQDGEVRLIQSRKRVITPEDDNMGFARWVRDNEEEIVKMLPHGRHYGEWAGPGIQKNPHNYSQKRFVLFNPAVRVNESYTTDPSTVLPEIYTVPVLYNGPYTNTTIEDVMWRLKADAEFEGYKPEGVVVYFHTFRQNMKVTFENSGGKWQNG